VISLFKEMSSSSSSSQYGPSIGEGNTPHYVDPVLDAVNNSSVSLQGGADYKAPVSVSNPGWITDSVGNSFRAAGYNYLGPGTDVEGNINRGVQPVNELDAIARTHDIAYNDIKNQFERGLLTYAQAKGMISQADTDFVESAKNSYEIPNILSALSMSAKNMYDYYTGGSSFSGLDPNRYGINEDSVPPYTPTDFGDPVFDRPVDPGYVNPYDPNSSCRS